MDSIFGVGYFCAPSLKIGFCGTLAYQFVACTMGRFAHPHLVFYESASSWSCASHCFTRGSKECGASALVCSRVHVCFSAQFAATSSVVVPSHASLIRPAILPNRSAYPYTSCRTSFLDFAGERSGTSSSHPFFFNALRCEG